ncbi:MAG: exported protein of unknown function [Candidatus Saccharibacteria bacterium]|nr:exported protein of unknown function [Candidatus Saccharibacteria bacterium]
MQIRVKNKKTRKKLLLTTLIVVIILVLGYGVFASQAKIWPFLSANTVNLSPASDTEKSTGEQIKSDSVNSSPQPSKQSPSNDANPSTTTTSVLFSSTTQDTTTYHVRVLIESVLNTGTCSLTLVKSGQQTYTATADIQPGPSSSTCKGFDIPLSSIATGNWNATVTVTSSGTSGAASQEILVK